MTKGRGALARPMPYEALTRRERDVLAQLAKDSSNQTISTTLGLSVRTVETHLRHVYLRLAVESRAAAVRYAFLDGLADNTSYARVRDFTDVLPRTPLYYQSENRS